MPQEEDDVIQVIAWPPDVALNDHSFRYPTNVYFDRTRNEVSFNAVNDQPPVEQNRNNSENVFQKSWDYVYSMLRVLEVNFVEVCEIGGSIVVVGFVIILVLAAVLVKDDVRLPDKIVSVTVSTYISLEYEKYRLPRSVKPIHYNLNVLPILSDEGDIDKFKGEVLIHLEILETCQNITLHSHHLRIESIKLTNNVTNLGYMFLYDILIDEQFLIIYPDKILTKLDSLLLKIKFNGYFNKNGVGLHRTSYNYNGEVKSAIVTKMKPIHARKVFPCFDEPGFQATFQITIGHKAHMTALSNMPGNPSNKVLIDAKNEYVFTEFEKTPVMSTYLVAFAVVDNEVIKKYGIGIYSQHSQNETNMLKLTDKFKDMLEFFNKLLDYKDKHPNTTFITSNDLHNWDMVRWRLITLRNDVSHRNKDDVTIHEQEIKNVVIAHEIAHQWFENLITPEWWSHIWLTEGYSTYISYVVIDKLYPEDDAFIEFNKLKQDTLSKDSMPSTRAISKEVYAPDDIANNIRFVVYQKAASIIMMLDNFLTTEKHMSGLRSLLRLKFYQTIRPDDLYKNLAQESNTDLTVVQKFMNSWINQKGFPLVTVSQNPNNFMILKQEKFNFIKALGATADPDDTLWYIPLTYVYQDDKPDQRNEIIWMEPIKTITIAKSYMKKNHQWIILNSGQMGFYRVNYEPKEWRKIIRYLGRENVFHNIAPINRALLIDDSMALARAGYINYTIPFELLTYLKHENDYLPWTRAISNLKYVDIMLMKLQDYHKFKTFMQNLVSNIFRNISSIEPQSSRDLKIQTEIYEWACRVDLYECILQSKSYVNFWLQKKERSDIQVINHIPINLRSSVYCSAIRHGSKSVWNFLWKEFQNEKSLLEKEKILHGLSCTSLEYNLRDIILNASRGDLIDRKNFHKILDDVSQYAFGFDTVMGILLDHIHHKIPEIGKIEDIIKHSQITSKCNTEADLEMVQTITSGYNVKQADLTPLISEININILWMRKNDRNIQNWLDKRY